MEKLRMCDIARELGVSISQVSRALAGRPKVAPEVRQKILTFAEQHQYRNTANCHIPNYVILISWMGSFCGELINGMIRLSRKKKFHFDIAVSDSLESFRESRYDGIFGINWTDRLYEWGLGCNLPIVLINSKGNRFERISAVSPDGEQEAYLSIFHLARLGHKKIVRLRLGYSKQRPGTVGEKGIARAENEFHINIQNCNLNDPQPEDLAAFLKEKLEEGVTAFILVSMEYAEALFWKQLIQLGKRVPEDVSVIGYHAGGSLNSEQKFYNTFIDFDYESLAGNALELMEEAIHHDTEPEQREVPSILDISWSTGPAPRPSEN